MRKLYDWVTNISIVKKLMTYKVFSKLLSYEVVVYIFFGLVTTLVDLGVFAFSNHIFGNGPIGSISIFGKVFKISYVYLSNFLAWLLAVLVAFFTNKVYVFESRSWQAGLVLKEFVSFVAARVFSLLPSTLGLVLLFDILKINETISKIILTVFVVVLNYFFSKFIVFKKK